MAYSNYFNKNKTAGNAGTGFSSKYFQSGKQYDTPDFSTMMQEWEKTQKLQNLATRPQKIDEQAFGVARQKQPVQNPFDNWSPSAMVPDSGRVNARAEDRMAGIMPSGRTDATQERDKILNYLDQFGMVGQDTAIPYDVWKKAMDDPNALYTYYTPTLQTANALTTRPATAEKAEEMRQMWPTMEGMRERSAYAVTQDQTLINGALGKIKEQNAKYETALSNLVNQQNRAANNAAWGIDDAGATVSLENAQKVFDDVNAEWYTSRREALEMLGHQQAETVRYLARLEAEWEKNSEDANLDKKYQSLREQLKNAYGSELLGYLLEYAKQEENAKRMETSREEARAKGAEGGLADLGNLATVPQKLAGGVSGTVDALAQGLERGLTGSNAPVDWNTEFQEGTARADAFRSGEQEDMGGVGRFLYGTGMSMLDSVAAIATGQPWIMGMEAANSTMQEVKRNGGTDSQAMTLGVISGVAETLTEKLSIDSLFNLKSAESVKEILTNALKQAVPEATEEAISSVVDLLADSVIMGEKSQYQQMVRSGMSSNAAFLQLVKQVGLDSLGGALSGLAFGGGTSTIDYAADRAARSAQNRQAGGATQEQIATAPAEPRNDTGGQTDAPAVPPRNDGGEPAAYGILEKIFEMPRINNTVANTIIQNPELSAAFTEQAGVALEGTTEQKRQTIKDTVRDQQQRSLENEQIARQVAEQATEQAERDAEAERQRQEEEAVRNSGYRSYVIGIFANGVTTEDAQEILHNPQLKAEWEAVTGKTLPQNYKSAVKMILQTERDPQKLMQQSESQYTVRRKPEPNTKTQYNLGDMIEDRVTGRVWEVTEALPDGRYVVEAMSGSGQLMQQEVNRNDLRYKFGYVERDDGAETWYENWGDIIGGEETTGAEEEQIAAPPTETHNDGTRGNDAITGDWRRIQGPHHVPGKIVETIGDGENLYRPEGMEDEEYEKLNTAWKNREKAARERPETAAEWMISKEAFKPSQAVGKLGIRIDGSVVRWQNTEQLLEYEKAAKKSQRALDDAVKRLKPTREEEYLARGIAEGAIKEENQQWITANRAVVRELADMYKARDSFDESRLRKKRDDIKAANNQIANEIFGSVVDKGEPELRGVLRPFTKIIMNERTSERVLKQIFGDEDGQKVYDIYFRPHYRNDAEMSRFSTKMRDRVREFADKTGKKRALTLEERSMAQHMIEDQATVDAMNALKPKDREKVKLAAEAVNRGVQFDDAIREQKLTENEYLQGLTQAYADYMETVALTEKMDLTILNNAVREYTQLYEEMYDAMNEFLVNHGYQPVGFIKHYAPHFQKREVQQDLFSVLQRIGAEKQSVSSLPADLAGRTADFRPNRQWNPHERHRYGKKTEYDIEYGYAQYLDYFAKTIYRTDDIMRARQAVNWFRGKYSGDEISAAIEEAKADQFKPLDFKRELLEGKDKIKPGQDLTPEQIEEMYDQYVDKLYESAKPENLRKYAEFVTWLDNYANILAGKQSMADRGMEFSGGRESLTWVNAITSTFARANVGANLSSVLNQSAQLAEMKTRLGTYVERAIWDMARGTVGQEGFADKSDFLTERRGTTTLKAETEMEKAWVRAAFKPLEMADQMMSTIATRGRYLQALDEGMTEEQALREADDFGRRVMASRMKGERGQAFESKKLGSRLVHVFQTEASNTFDRLFLSDIPQTVRKIAKDQGKTAAAKYVAVSATRYLLSAFLLNAIAKEAYGGTPVPFDVIGWMVSATGAAFSMDDEEWLRKYLDDGWEKITGERIFGTSRENESNWIDGVKELLYQASNDVPYLQNIAGLMGWGDKTMPTVGVNEAATSIGNAAKTIGDQVFKGEEETGMNWLDVFGSVMDDAVNVGAQFVTGGRQGKKTYDGIKAMRQEGKVKGWGENEKLQYPVDTDALDWMSAALFGTGALNETEHFYASGDTALTASQTKKVRELEDYDVDQKVTYDLIQQFRDIDEELDGADASSAKRDAINTLDLSDEQKLQVFRVLMKNEIKLEDYRGMMEAGLSWDDITRAENAAADLREDDSLDAGEKARTFELWTDEQGWTPAQQELISEQYKFYWNMPAEASGGEDKYDYLAGRLENGVPEETVLSALSEEQRELYEGHAKKAGISASVYLDVMQYKSEAKEDEQKSKSQKVGEYINKLKLSGKQKHELWQAVGYSPKTSPFD